MHSSRMRTVRCSNRLLGGGEDVCAGGLPRGCLPDTPLWTEFLTNACENITFPQLRLRTVIKVDKTFERRKPIYITGSCRCLIYFKSEEFCLVRRTNFNIFFGKFETTCILVTLTHLVFYGYQKQIINKQKEKY